MKDRTLAVVVLGGTIAFLYQMSEVLKHHTCWCEMAQPAGVGEVVFALVCGLGAVGAALGLNVSNLIASFGKHD